MAGSRYHFEGDTSDVLVRYTDCKRGRCRPSNDHRHMAELWEVAEPYPGFSGYHYGTNGVVLSVYVDRPHMNADWIKLKTYSLAGTNTVLIHASQQSTLSLHHKVHSRPHLLHRHAHMGFSIHRRYWRPTSLFIR